MSISPVFRVMYERGAYRPHNTVITEPEEWEAEPRYVDARLSKRRSIRWWFVAFRRRPGRIPAESHIDLSLN